MQHNFTSLFSERLCTLFRSSLARILGRSASVASLCSKGIPVRAFSLLLGCAVCMMGSDSSAQVPQIDKIDPPNWWTEMPAPMLLVHGEHLDSAQFAVQGHGVLLTHSQASENGHWAFLWINTDHAAPQTLEVIARNQKGAVRKPYVLSARNHSSNAHRGFNAADVLYEIMPDRFADGDQTNDAPGYDRTAPRGWHGGDLKGIEQHLDYLQQLGVTALWLTPVVSNGSMPESYHGYAATDLYAVDSHLGTIDEYKRFSGALHAHGIKLLIDLAPNHIGVQHPWVKDPPAPDWFHGSLSQHRPMQPNLYELINPHAPPQAWTPVTNGWFTDSMPDLNQENPLVAQYLIQNALWWVETADIDAIRLDTFQYVSRAFWRDFHSEVHKLYPGLTTLGEVLYDDAEATSFFAGGTSRNGIDSGLDTPFDYPMNFTLRDVLAGDKPMTAVSCLLRQDALYPHPERLVTFIDTHDTVRFITAAHGSVPKLKIALGMISTLRGTPLIYSGDEIAMLGGEDPDNRRDFPGGFPNDTHDAFLQQTRTAAEEESITWVTGLIALRKMHPAIQTGIEQDLLTTSDVFVYARSQDVAGCTRDHTKERILVVVNKSASPQAVDLDSEDTVLAGCTDFHVLAPTKGEAPKLAGPTVQIEAPAENVTVFSVR